MRFPEELDRDVLTRLRRIEGQVRGLQRLVTEGAECRDIVIQLAATGSALDRVGFKLMAAGLRECATSDGEVDTAELEELFLKLA
ncbi:MAG: metal-sensitive transcriptional regulator [Acidimicrobiales bacterium]